MKPIIILLVMSIIFYCCKKEDKPYQPVTRCSELTRNIDTINLYIHGSWEWLEELRVSRYNGVQYLTPSSEKYHLLLNLYGDTAKFFVNNAPDSIYKFKIQRELEITNYPTDSLPVIVFYSFFTGQRRSYVPLLICKNQLLMQYQFVSSIAGENLWERN